MTSFRIDLDQVAHLAARLESVASALQGEAHGQLGVSALGDGAAVAAMSGFVSGWSHGRTEIVTGVRSAHTLLVGAAGNYRQSDQNMAARLRPASAR